MTSRTTARSDTRARTAAQARKPSRLRYVASLGAAALVAVGCVLSAAGATHAAGGGRVNQLIGESVHAVDTVYPDGLRDVVDEHWFPLPTAGRAPGEARPVQGAHAHNDYEHGRPLLDAIDHGFTSVEVDVSLVDGELLVGHGREAVVPGWSLERLYLSPLEELRKANGGTIYPGWDGDFQLLIDVKSTAGPTYAALDDALREHPRLMTSFTAEGIEHRAVTAVISGHRDREAMEGTPTQYAGYDGRLGDLDGEGPASFMPLVSADWTETFTWDGTGEMPAAEEQKLRDIVTTAHDHGARVRFWATPDEPGPARDAIWRELVDAGVDVINTDDLAALQGFLSA